MINPAYAAVPIASVYPLANNFTSFGDLFSVLLKNAFTLAGLLFLLILISSALMYILGNGNKEQIQKAGLGITAGIIGLVIIFAAYWIVQIVELVTGLNILK